MTIDKLSRLFSTGSTSQTYKNPDSTAQKVDNSKASSSEAVEVSDSFGTQSAADGSHSNRVAEIKAAVQNGTYKVDSHAVAEAFAREIFA